VRSYSTAQPNGAPKIFFRFSPLATNEGYLPTPWRIDCATAAGKHSFTQEKTMQDHVSHLLDYLRAEGYPAELDGDGDIRFKREGKTYALCFDAHDPNFARLLLPSVWDIDSERERQQVLAALDEVNRRIKLVKAHTLGDSVWFSVEFLFDEQAAWEHHLSRAARAIMRAVMLFADAMQGARAAGEASPTLN
jgi:hypothetical protein